MSSLPLYGSAGTAASNKPAQFGNAALPLDEGGTFPNMVAKELNPRGEASTNPPGKKNISRPRAIEVAGLRTPIKQRGTRAVFQSSLPGVSSIVSNFNGTAIPGGDFIWFSSVFKAGGLGSQPVRIFLRAASVQFTAAGATYQLPVPDATITFSPTATSATTAYDGSKNQWNTTVPSTGLAGNTLLSGMMFPVPAGGLPGGINPVTWSGTFYSDTSGVSLNWQWAAAVYRSFSTDYNALDVKPVDDTSASIYQNSDHAGTPEAYKSFVAGGARGGGGSNYTGSYSGTASIVPIDQIPNSPPTANAGPAQTVFVGSTVQLDGSGSTDPDGDPLTYTWSFTSKIPTGSKASLSGANTVKPTFVVDLPGEYDVQLIVNDGLVDSPRSTVPINTKNSPPVANAGPNQTISTGALVQLNGSGSTDVDGDPLTYSWSLTAPAGSTATLSNLTVVNPTFVADVKGTYTAQLVVNDGTFDSTPPSEVTISDVNSPPVANAGLAQTVTTHTLVTLDGSRSTDVDGDALTYTWSMLSSPAGSAAVLSDIHAIKPTFTVDLPGDYVIQLMVNDGTVNSPAATVTITTQNSPPVANAGPAQTVQPGSVVTLNGSRSFDVDGQTLTYSWSIVNAPTGSTAVLTSPTGTTPSFTVDEEGDYVIQLIVNDGIVNSQPATVTISTVNSAPVANPGAVQTVETGSVVALDGSGSNDADGNSLTFRWAILSQPAGGTAALSDAHIVNPSFAANVAGLYVVQLSVNDGKVGTFPATVTVTAETPQLQLSAPAPVFASPGQTVALSFTASNTGAVPAQGAIVTQGAATISLATVPAGQSVPATVSISVPAVAAKAPTETDAEYVTRLQASDNQTTSVQASLTWNDLTGALFGPVSASASLTEQLPIITINLTAPASAHAADTITYTVTLTNSGHAPGTISNLSVTLPDGSVDNAVPAQTTLAPGASTSVPVQFAVPITQTGSISATAQVTWQDANLNAYGPVSSSATTQLNGISPAVLASCIPSGSMSVLIQNGNVISYVPNGSWSGVNTGIRVVPVEGGGSVAAISTPKVVNSCSSNSVTGQTVCTANETDVYLLSGSSLTGTLTSGSTGTASFSGGDCQTCGVTVNAATNQAVLTVGLSRNEFRWYPGPGYCNKHSVSAGTDFFRSQNF